ncbi:MAG TPA: hypothetical protein VNW29_06485 [Candidatus Sulfotelmatobacter sp.]|jgi:hypothetical protein|nr:hypothetical protein [Candidatus Sulfotelmatobacter sp.]
MKIGFDLDKVFINTPPFIPNAVINKFYKQRDNGILLYRIPSRPEQLFRKALHVPILRKQMRDNFASLRELSKEKKHQLYLISSRFKFLEPETQRLVKKYALDTIFDKLYFNYNNKQPHKFKNEILQKLNLDIFIDDDLSLIRYVAKNNPHTNFFWLDEHAQGAKISDNITAVRNLGEIFHS